ncbi:hypothetical protein AB0I53_08275 [Saccharopolyspora sp. NPDC050389]|uniref:hypothetical protein n=1 Tax=Saccharopolyspora sp. NPDC050389 TaxID=3155516 RepID=UPI00340FA7F5
MELRNNPLQRLPDSIAALTGLTHLDLRATALRELPEGLAALPNLTKLDLRWTKLDHHPCWLDELRHRGCAVLL